MADANVSQKLVVRSQGRDSTGSGDVQADPNATQPQVFKYEAIQSDGHIRLLKLLPDRESDAPLACQLVQAKLSENPLYAAVSYTWDNSGPLDSVLVNGRVLSVRKNVADLLRRLRTGDYTRTLWIDSICINQAQEAERSSQVRLMGDIFAGASYVIAWLDCLTGVENSLKAFRDSLTENPTYYSRSGNNLQLSGWFLGHKYWTRRWIVQEVLLARSIHLVSGKDQIPLSVFNEAFKAKLDANRLLSLRMFGEQARLSPFLRLFFPDLHQRHRYDKTLVDLLYTYRYSDCSEPMDRVYALVSLSKKAVRHLKIDYEINRQSLLLSVLDFCTEHEGLLRHGHDGLAPHRAISLISLLKRQLRITDGELQQALSQRANSSGLQVGGNHFWNKAFMYKRGTVASSTSLPSKFEEHILHCRSRIPPLGRVAREGRYKTQKQNGSFLEGISAVSEPLERISGHDLFEFAFTLSNDKESSDFSLGLSSSWLEAGDELFQFYQTPVALCVRKSFGIVGRASLLKESPSGNYDFSDSLSSLTRDELLDFYDDAMVYRAEKAAGLCHVQTDVPSLMSLLKWVDFDD